MFKQMHPFRLSCHSKTKDQQTLYEDSCPILARKIADNIKVAEAKPPLINQQCVVYKFKCDSCDADYVGHTRWHFFQRIDKHQHSAIGNHLWCDAHNQNNKDLNKQFSILKKYRGKFEWLIFEMFFIQEMKPKLNTQSDSIKAKLLSS